MKILIVHCTAVEPINFYCNFSPLFCCKLSTNFYRFCYTNFRKLSRRIFQIGVIFFLTTFAVQNSASITIMFITNELVFSAITKTPNIVKSSLKDIELFSRDAHNQILNSVHDGINTAVERIKYDLESKIFIPVAYSLFAIISLILLVYFAKMLINYLVSQFRKILKMIRA